MVVNRADDRPQDRVEGIVLDEDPVRVELAVDPDQELVTVPV